MAHVIQYSIVVQYRPSRNEIGKATDGIGRVQSSTCIPGHLWILYKPMRNC